MPNGLLLAAIPAALTAGMPPASGQPPGAETDQPIPAAKLDQYMKGDNVLVGTFGLRDPAAEGAFKDGSSHAGT